MKLLEYSDAEYIMFCDQDDVWLPNKIELSLDKMKELEQNNGYDIPLLVFTDLKVVDEKLITIQESFWKYQKLIPNISTHWKKLVAQNVITGCTIIMNQNAKEASLPFVLDMMIHDQWIGVNVTKYGKIDFLYNQTILYRQHGKNVAGAHSYGIKYISHKLNNFGNILKYFFSVSKHFKDISVFELIINKVLINVNRFIRN